MNIRISADSTCDLSPELIEKYGAQNLEEVFERVVLDREVL